MSLKTLNDFKQKGIFLTEFMPFVKVENNLLRKLRTEAVKQIKKSEDGKDWICDMVEANIWIKWFFNIKESELENA